MVYGLRSPAFMTTSLAPSPSLSHPSVSHHPPGPPWPPPPHSLSTMTTSRHAAVVHIQSDLKNMHAARVARPCPATFALFCFLDFRSTSPTSPLPAHHHFTAPFYALTLYLRM